jgi:hypothetical protein
VGPYSWPENVPLKWDTAFGQDTTDAPPRVSVGGKG